MYLSDEPGYYRDGAFGMRCENLLVVRAVEQAGERPMLCFEALTLVPFDTRLLDLSLLRPDELAWLDAYHRRVARALGPLLEPADAAWLERATRPLAA